MPDTFAVTLTPEDQATLRTVLQQAKTNGRTLTRARILLKAGEGWSDAELMRAFDVCQKTIRHIRLVQDNLNTHLLASLYETFPPAEARRLAQRFELHY